MIAMDYLKPSKTFLEAGKKRFLAAFDLQFGARVPASGFRQAHSFAFKVIMAAVAVFGLTSGAAVYADARNVPADSPLYPLKRVAESVQLTFAATEARPALQGQFAARRLGEINDLAERNPKSNALPKLQDDLHEAMDSSVNGAEQPDLPAAALSRICSKLRSVMGTSSLVMQDELIAHPKLLQHFDDRCASGRP